MPYNEELAARLRAAIGGQDGITEKKMFGGIGFMVNGNMCCGVAKDDLMVRVGSDGYDDALAQPYARPMDLTGRPMKGFVFVSLAGVREETALREWVSLGVAFAKSLPPK